MQIQYKTGKLAKSLTNDKIMVRTYGDKQTKKLKSRLASLRAARTLSDLGLPFSPPERCHELKEGRKGQLSVDLAHPYRLLFEPLENPYPKLPDGGLDWSRVTGIMIIGVENTHG
jgi:proteic killer suppression protein